MLVTPFSLAFQSGYQRVISQVNRLSSGLFYIYGQADPFIRYSVLQFAFLCLSFSQREPASYSNSELFVIFFFFFSYISKDKQHSSSSIVCSNLLPIPFSLSFQSGNQRVTSSVIACHQFFFFNIYGQADPFIRHVFSNLLSFSSPLQRGRSRDRVIPPVPCLSSASSRLHYF